MFAIQVWLLLSYPSRMGHLSFSVWQPEMENELFFSNFSWSVANYSCGSVIFWWWPCEIVRKQGKKSSGQWLWSTRKTNCVFCVVAADIAPEVPGEQVRGRAVGGHHVPSTRSCCTWCFFAFPAGPAPRNCCSAGSVGESLAENAQRKLSSAVWQQALPSLTGAWKLCSDTHIKAHLRLPSCVWCLATRRLLTQHNDSARLRAEIWGFDWGISGQNCTHIQWHKATWKLEPSSLL